MPTAVKMPSLGQTSDELRLLVWLKSEGEPVAEGEPLFEAETDKTTLEVESVVSGTLLTVLCAAGETVAAGTVVAWIGDAGETVPAADGSQGAAEPEPPSPRLRATPAARALAREHGIDLAGLTGSGPAGQIERRDVLEAIATEPDESQRVPKHRQAIATRLERAARVPQFTLTKTIDARRSVDRLRDVPNASLTHVLLQAVGAALRSSPVVNRVWVDDGPRYRVLERCDVGLAVAVEDNLLVPTIPEPDSVPLEDLAAVARRAVDEARSGRLTAAFAGPAAVTVSNLGMFGIDRFEAIVDPDQTAILAVGRLMTRPAVTDQGIEAVSQLDLTLTVDHRTVDGADAARFLAAICAQLEG